MEPGEEDEFLRTVLRSPSQTGAVPGPDPLAHYLVATAGSEPGKRVEIGSAPLTIGRDGRQSLVFAGDSEVSRLHAQVSLVDGEAIAEDLGSTNGTFVDGARITKPTSRSWW